MIRFTMQAKLTILILFIVSFSLLLSGFFVISNIIQSEESALKQHSFVAARTVAELPEISAKLTNLTDNENDSINQVVEPIRAIHNADYIIVLDQNRIRHSHPVPSMIGAVSAGNDENAAFAEHTYTTKAQGEAGTIIRTFVPILDENHTQVGVVIAGFILPTFWEVLTSLNSEIYLTTALSLLFGGSGAVMLARHIKKKMFHLEPEEISKMLVERTETFNAMEEGFITIDSDERITVFNKKAKQMFNIEENIIGKKIHDVFPDMDFSEVLQTDTAFYNKEISIENMILLRSHIPIKVNSSIVGAVAIFQDLTKMKQLAEELTGVKAFVSALRVQNHEHINKLHTIAGLIQLGNSDQALDYVLQQTDEQSELIRFLSKNIKADSVSGLLLSKIRRGKELGINVIINRRSTLTSFPKGLDHHDFVIILGNLIENAFDSFNETKNEEREIFISIEESDHLLTILVDDNGSGISPHDLKSIFDEGFSTKQGKNYGIGLHLVKQTINHGNGLIDVESKPEEGTTFIITFEI